MNDFFRFPHTPHLAWLGDGEPRADLMLFGEWCTAVHSVRYDALPDWFPGFDVYDRAAARFLDPAARDTLFASMGIEPVPLLAQGRFDLPRLQALLDTSRLGNEPMESSIVSLSCTSTRRYG